MPSPPAMPPGPPELGRILILVGILFLVTGLVVVALGRTNLPLGRMNLPLGRLPGDFNLRGRNWSFSFPIVTCLLLSGILSLLFWLFSQVRR